MTSTINQPSRRRASSSRSTTTMLATTTTRGDDFIAWSTADDLVSLETSTATYTFPRLLPASLMPEGPMVITRYDRQMRSGLPSRERFTDETREMTGSMRDVAAPIATFSDSHRNLHGSLRSSPNSNLDSHPKAPSPTLTPKLPRSLPSNSNTVSFKQNVKHGKRNESEISADTMIEDIDWIKHTRCTTSTRTGEAVYTCKYLSSCGYSSTKQSVKRHLLGTHLGFKPHECPYCDKHFPARAALSSHIATHTGELPLACRYEGCSNRYADPARRHRHHIRAHGYKPKEYKKKFRPPVQRDETDGGQKKKV